MINRPAVECISEHWNITCMWLLKAITEWQFPKEQNCSIWKIKQHRICHVNVCGMRFFFLWIPPSENPIEFLPTKDVLRNNTLASSPRVSWKYDSRCAEVKQLMVNDTKPRFFECVTAVSLDMAPFATFTISDPLTCAEFVCRLSFTVVLIQQRNLWGNVNN